jgi:hypothetical protein
VDKKPVHECREVVTVQTLRIAARECREVVTVQTLQIVGVLYARKSYSGLQLPSLSLVFLTWGLSLV